MVQICSMPLIIHTGISELLGSNDTRTKDNGIVRLCDFLKQKHLETQTNLHIATTPVAYLQLVL